ncbi:gibberellin-regulated protein 1-like [Chenopodium quinoa]|uniref:gibberellin-regulated protein 1-like n=1 Tax=Chenopodium quinoa TaxID=63459 RepID=UPI000B7861F0|nr:gibberellin-regulated protein 1-like [Chenopodium quinoa]
MAFSKALIASLLLSLLVLQLVHAFEPETISNQMTRPGNVSESKVDCGAACAVRCSATKRPNLCKRACGSCCSKCNCVPPGTFGNYEACPCYANLTTKNKMHKCP